MASSNLETRLENLLKPVIEELQYELYDIQYAKEGKNNFLRITIDQPQGIKIEDCEKVNKAIDTLLDQADLIKESYFLEVSSPGVERILRKNWHFEKQIGNVIRVKLYQAIEKQKEFEGILMAYEENELYLQIEEQKLKIEQKNIALAKTVADI